MRKQIIVETAADAEFTSNGRGRNLTTGGIDDLNDNDNPPALPPKRQRINSRTASVITTPPSSPKLITSHGAQPQELQQHHHHHQPQSQQLHENNCSSQPNADDGRMKNNHSLMVNDGVGDGGGGGSVESVKNAAPTGTHNDSYIQLYDCSVLGKQSPMGLTGHSTNIVEDEEVEVVLRHNPNSKQVDTKFALLYVCVIA